MDKQKWYDVAAKLPEPFEDVLLVYGATQDMCVGWWDCEFLGFQRDSERGPYPEVPDATHWMPLPAPPNVYKGAKS